jgi:RNA polymerase sigma-70 factor (ECF subfamily)
VQDASLALLASGGSWERSYFFATVRNRFIDRYRRGRKVLFVAIEHDDGIADDFTWEAPDVLETGLLEQALGKLRTEEREALFLAVVEGYTAEEIGKMTDHPRGTILSLLHRAKKKLRDLLSGDGGVL